MESKKELAPIANVSEVEAAQPHSTELMAGIDVVYPESVEECHKMIGALETERLNRSNAIVNMGNSFAVMSGCLGHVASGNCDNMEVLKLTVGMKELLDNFYSNIQQMK